MAKPAAHTHPYRGDRMQHVLSNGVIIDTTFAAKTPEEKDSIDADIQAALEPIIESILMRGEEL
ncbi:hypothetical protein EBB07_00090 [Paenibacillaceae bacterium]|nr:hypothetical protein EBB07_00090 [Paenibacillaceae bacterium]